MARTKDFDENEVLCKAIQLFWHKGYNATSMQDLVDGLGISRSSLYDTYTDKHTLFLKALESYQTKGAAKIQGIINEGNPTKETIKKLLQLATNDLTADAQQRGCFMVNAEIEVASSDEEVNQMVCKNDQQMEEAFYQVIKRGQDNGEIKNSRDARALSRFILNTLKGMRVSAKSISDKVFFEDIINLTVSVLG
ncbi:TetR/AcrR family transcriptional regulator [Mucilaginibacter terrae]|uniref:TetR/AcrR family transcriptional repressor of nem operon n=1 Tax=Mucilaginibacter terrae TaxID=1955052 RepID=A0ABU3GX30_9SPHI|nr:TetR/AcrR family transcriptional regulator [Mucilaginibacter terrae]MDT3404031.1 TetR/AcrR family transcriptional repressor of nem operon [Mucilaginibacter terrae]